MADPQKPQYNRRLHGFTVVYLIFCALMFSGNDPLFPLRYGGFFLLTQLLVQVIFPQFRCSKTANLTASLIIIIGTIVISHDS